MKYWLISQNLISEEAKKDIGEKQIGDTAKVHVGNWGQDTLKIDDISEEKFISLGFEKKSESIYQLLEFKNEVKIGDIVILIESQSSIYGVGKITSGLKKSEEVTLGKEEIGFYREIQFIYKIEDKRFKFEINEIKEFSKTLREIQKERYEEIRSIIFQSQNENLTNKAKLIGFLIENRAFSKEKGFTSKEIRAIGIDPVNIDSNTENPTFGYFIDYDHFSGRYYLLSDGKKNNDTHLSKAINEIIQGVQSESQVISKENLYNILISLSVSNFLIFSGPSGIGKTSIVKKIDENLRDSRVNRDILSYKKLSVKSNFTDESSIVGYWNPLLSKYEGTEVLKFIINSYRDENTLYFLLLDEMNLSRVENYFSSFLSEIDKLKDYKSLDEEELPKIFLFETIIANIKQYQNIKYFLETYFGDGYEENIGIDVENSIYLKSKNDFLEYGTLADESGNFKVGDIKSIKVFLRIKNNLRVIGTINEDETTNSLSNKVLDRSQFITFEIEDLFGDNSYGVSINKDLLERDFFSIINEEKIRLRDIEKNFKDLEEYQKIKELIKAINYQIQRISINESIGYRAIEEIMNYIKNYCDYKGGNRILNLDQALDNQISQKILTKLKTFSLVSEENKNAFKEIGVILNYEDGKKIEEMKGFGTYPKSLRFYHHLKNNML